jgi:hypothetical protein
VQVRDAARSLDPTQRISDSLVVAAVVVLSLIVYVGRLGFNSDDWAFLARLTAASDQDSIIALCQALFANEGLRLRPVQIVYLATLYAFFGVNPTGYHLVNAAVLVASAVTFYLVARELWLPRALALAIAVVYALLPNYSADRFWPAAAQAPLSVWLYLVSLLIDLRLVSGRTPHLWPWKSVSLVALLMSGLAYELILPFIPLNLLLMWWHAQRVHGVEKGRCFVRAHAALVFGTNVAVLCALVAFKLATTRRVRMNEGYIAHIVYLVNGTVRANYFTFGAGIPYLTVWGLRGDLSPGLVLAGVAIVVLVGVYVYRSLAEPDWAKLTSTFWLKLILSGVFVSFWGYAIFINNDNVVFTTSNVDTRTAIVATGGVAMVLIGCLGWISHRLSERVGKLTFSVSVAALCLYGFLVINRLATFWVAAYQEELNILYDIRDHLPTLRKDTTLILDGTCLDIGPVFVFRFNWDLSGALAIMYRDPSLKATVVTPETKLESSEVLIRTFRVFDDYPYGPDLLLYNGRQKVVYALTDFDRARTYFDTLASKATCPPPFSWRV